MTTSAETESVAAQEEHAAQTRKLESRALKGTYYVVAFYAVALTVRMASSIVLSRLFTPEYFGILALLTTVLVGLNLFSHIGLQDSVIQNPRGDEPLFLNTTWTLQALRGVLLWVLTVVLAWPVARFYHEPRMLALFPALGFGCVIAGFSSPSLLTLARHLGVGKLSFLELLSQLVQFLVTWIWAVFHPTLWALIAGRIASELIRTVISYFMLPEIRPRFAWDSECVRTLLTFGKWILIGTALNFLALQSDRLILGKLVSFELLGIYTIAYSVSDLPRQIISQFCSRVGFPFIARFTEKPRDEYRRVLLKYRLPVLAVGGLMLILVICTGDIFITHVYDKRYHAAAWMIGILAAGLWHTLLYSTIYPAILSLSKAHYNAAGYLAYCITLFVLIPVGFTLYGMPGAVAAVALSDLPTYFVALYSAYREKVGTFLQDMLMTIGFAAALAGALALRVALGLGLPFHGIR
jgi:O-antigen/teichoic acid export membrane protein